MNRRAAIALILLACGAPSAPPTSPVDQQPEIQLGADAAAYWPAAAWRTARPSQVGIADSVVSAIIARARTGQFGAIHGLIIVRKGYLLTEEYFGGWTRDSIHTMQSVTKSVTSLLTGIAISRGDIRGVDQSLVELLPTYQPVENDNTFKRDLKVRDVLSMRTGMNWNEDPYAGSPLEHLNNRRDDWIRFVVDWPMREQPGTRWQYNSGGVIALGGAVGLSAGVNTADYAREHLLRPIGITDDKWFRGYPNLLPHMGGGLVMHTLDLARIGYLVLRNGVWNSQQIVPASWIRESTQRTATPTFAAGGHPADYGYLWWLLPLDGVAGHAREPNELMITAWGAQGQWLFVVPKYDLVVAINAGNLGADNYAPDMMYHDLLPALR